MVLHGVIHVQPIARLHHSQIVARCAGDVGIPSASVENRGSTPYGGWPRGRAQAGGGAHGRELR